MSPLEITVILFGAFIGYWIVSHFVGGKKPHSGKEADDIEGKSADFPNSSDDDGGKEWHQVLQVAPDASHEQVRTAYKTLIGQYHPDKVAGLGEELRALSEAKTKEINVAYQQALRHLGVSS